MEDPPPGNKLALGEAVTGKPEAAEKLNAGETTNELCAKAVAAGPSPVV